MDILVTGGAGYIGSTICSALADRGDNPIILDSLITGDRRFVRDFDFFHADISDVEALKAVRSKFPRCETVIHCAARTVVSESMSNPSLYYAENVSKSIGLFDRAIGLGFNKFLFSSSASVYGQSGQAELFETDMCLPLSPYARSKLIVEEVLKDFCTAYRIHGLSLRYFNPIGADSKLRTGQRWENATHLIGSLIKVLENEKINFEIYGNDWPTRDGTAIRDFIHVWDLALAHLSAVDFLNRRISPEQGAYDCFNIGTGTGSTVKEVVEIFNSLVRNPIPINIAPRRPGDIVGAFANVTKANGLLNWKAKHSLESAIKSSIQWFDQNTASDHVGIGSC